jgi:hypothetical protein
MGRIKVANKLKDLNKVIDDVTNATKKAVEEVTKTITKENVNKTAKDIKDKVETIVDSGEKIVLETTKKVKRKTIKPELFIESHGNQTSYEEILEKVYCELEGKTDMVKIKSIKIYFKSEEGKAYCVVNENETVVVEL